MGAIVLTALLPTFVEFYSNLGLAWIYLGGLRFHLLSSLDVIDPAMKITCKLSELKEKISSLELNIEVVALYIV